MRVLHINQSDIVGGAAIAAYRLHQGLLQAGVDSKLLVGQVTCSDPLINSTPRTPFRKKLKSLADAIGLNYITELGTLLVVRHPFYKEADVLNFHNLHGGYFNYLFVPKLTRHKPAVYTLHDMWSFTGHCSYSFDCYRWQTGCGKCPYPDVYPSIKRDNTALEWKLKKWVYQHSKLIIVTPSLWLMEQLKFSILNHLEIYHVPYGVNLETYRPIDKSFCRYFLGVDDRKYVLLTSAMDFSDRRKGGDLLVKALNLLPDSIRKVTVLLTLGGGSHRFFKEVDMAVLPLGYIQSDHVKAGIFGAADLFVLPTRADNLPLVLQEAMACGVPLVSFAVGGVPELVRPGVTGALAQPEDYRDLAYQIERLLTDETYRLTLAHNCRTIALQEYDLTLQVQRYRQLYQEVQATFT